MNEPFTIDDLFISITDVYTQYDEGEIPLAEANDILKRCCQSFLTYLEDAA
jgi:hypothetical protein